MSKKDRPGTNSPPRPAPARPAEFDANWDDETVPGLDLDDPLNEFDRVTAIPEVPSEQYVKSVMDTVEDSPLPAPGAAAFSPPASRPAAPTPPPPAPPPVHSSMPTLAADEYFSLDSEPPPSPRSPDSTARYAAFLPHNAPTARPAAPAQDPALPTPSPPLTGLQFAGEDSIPPPETGPIVDMKDRYAMGDFSGALLIAEGIIETDPADLEAPRYAQSCRDVLTQMYSARLGSLDRVVVVAVPSDQIRWLTLDHRAGFLLSLIDGGITVDQILDISGMPRLDALRIMYQLLDQRVISLAG